MKVLLTGASSFTGYWFAYELARAGFSVVAPLRGAKGSYHGVRALRVERLHKLVEIVWEATFGEGRFLQLAAAGQFDVLCHHAAQVGDYRSAEFDVGAALAANVKSLPNVLSVMKGEGLSAMILTGSVFEPDEGAGTTPLRAFSPYGISKSATAAVVRYWCAELSLPLGKFVIPNPFGSFEEARFCSYLIKAWQSGNIAEVRTPRYVRDNIHVGLLAKAYVEFIRATTKCVGFSKVNPSGYVETQGAFAQRVAKEIGPRLNLKCELSLLEQVEATEPMVRINTDPIDGQGYGWNEKQGWDDLAEYYHGQASNGDVTGPRMRLG